MTVTNDFLGFCQTDTGTNLIEQSAWPTDPGIAVGMQPGIASSARTNKALRQATYIAGQLAQFLANKTQASVLDNALPAQLLAQIFASLQAYPPNITPLLSGTGTFNLTYIFHVASGNATAGATYTNNGVTYTVISTIAAGLVLHASGSGAPTTSGTLTKASGTGDATLVFYAVRAPQYLRVKALGGGAGGNGASASSDGANTTFGSGSLIIAGKGTGGTQAAGGSVTVTAPAIQLVAVVGGWAGAAVADSASVNTNGGSGASGPFGGGGGPGGGLAGTGENGTANSGAGGGSGAVSTGGNGGGGGSAGGYVEAQVNTPTTIGSFPWVVGAGGAGGAGTGSVLGAGGTGGSGMIVVEECYQ